MSTAEKEYRLNYWYTEGQKMLKLWLQDNTKKSWNAFLCCVACEGEYDKRNKDARTIKLQQQAWAYGCKQGEVTPQEWENSGFYNPAILKK